MWVMLFFLAIGISSYAMYRRYQNMPEAFVWASLCIGGGVAISTEILSLFSAFRIEWLIMFWLGFCVLLVIAYHLWQQPASLSKIRLAYWLIPVLGLLALTLLTALIAPPNTYDSMTYHMTRITYWEQHGSVAHYPVHDVRQIYQHPFAEYIIAHLQILSGGDRFANLPQWFAYLGSLILLVPISQKLGATTIQTRLAVLLGATIPMAITQASSTQNDLVTGYWVLCAMYFALSLREDITLPRLIGLGMAVGLALLTKGTSYTYLAPILIWLTLSLALKHKLNAIYKLAVAGLIAGLLFLPHITRNILTFNSPTGPNSSSYVNGEISLGFMTSNVLRNVALQYMPISHEPFWQSIGTGINTFVEDVHHTLNIDLNDRRTTWGRATFPVIGNIPPNSDDLIPNPIHMTLVFLSLAIVLFKRKPAIVVQYALVCVGMWLLFALIIKWQPWHTRLLMPGLMLFVPIIALTIHRYALFVVCIVTLLFGYFWAFQTPLRPLAAEFTILESTRNSLYRMSQDYPDFSQLALAQNCPIGFHFLVNTTEYLFHVALKQNSSDGRLPQIGHVFVDGAENYAPCVIIGNMPLPAEVEENWQLIKEVVNDGRLNHFRLWIKTTQEGS